MISILTLHKQSVDFANVRISNRCAYDFQCFPIHIERYRGKYLLRRIPHASHGSFNPYVITNKEAHIINGNMFGNVTKDKTRAISELSQQTTKDRRHFMNYCFTHAGKFSWAVDCFLDLTFAVFKDSLNCIFERKLSEACFQLENYDLQTDMTLIREPISAYLRERCNSYASMSANAVFSDIFTMNTVGSLLGLSCVPPHNSDLLVHNAHTILN